MLVFYLAVAFALLIEARRYVFVPIRVFFRHGRSVDSGHVPFDLAEIDPQLATGFRSVSTDLATLGFVAIAHLRRKDHIVLDSHVSIWVNAQNKDIANVIVVRRRSGRPVSLVTFRQNYTDEVTLATSNTNSARVFAWHPKAIGLRCNGLWNLSKLYDVHRAWVKHRSAGRTAVIPADGLAYQQQDWVQSINRQVETGYYQLSSDRQQFCPTLKGAFLMTWKLLFPWKQILRFRRRKETDRILAELGFVNLQSLLNSQGQP